MLDRFQREYAFRSHFASEECAQLLGTLRERLTQAISGRKTRLLREKEQLDIADTSALLLHPNQFSITNPASPGGIHSNRKTRHTRHRVDLDDLGHSNGNGNGGVGGGSGTASAAAAGTTAAAGDAPNKRKRKAPDDDTGSPVREPAALLPQPPPSRASMAQAQAQNAPIYSIHSLFTDKELSAHANQAHIATVHFFATSKRPDQPFGAATNGDNTDAEDSASLAAAAAAAAGDGGIGPDDVATRAAAAAAAADMLRSASQTFHATRSTRTAAAAAAASAFSALAELSDKPATRPSLPYHILANYHARPNGNAPPLPALMNEEIDDDCARIDRLLHARPAGWLDKALAEVLVEPFAATAAAAAGAGAGGDPPNPDRFSLLHPAFPVDMGVHWYPARPNGGQDLR